MSKASKAWDHFQKINADEAKCLICKSIILTKGGSTKGLLTHLRSKHATVFDAKFNETTSASPSITKDASAGCDATVTKVNMSLNSLKRENASKTSSVDLDIKEGSSKVTIKRVKQPQLLDYFEKDKNTLSEVLSRMVAKDAISFRTFTTSSDLRLALAARGFDVPRSTNTICSKVMEFANSVKLAIASDLSKRRQAGEVFSLTMDEWSSLRNRRYANINIHFAGYYYYY